MRPSNADLGKAVAGEVLTEVFAVLNELGYALSIQEMRHLMDRVESRLQRAGANKNGVATEARVG
ncbi:MAG: hypothetical protein K2X87_10460 [Gemmataceae bacterium]|nr:hypothetical protein [Gemmataceae bacterium]